MKIKNTLILTTLAIILLAWGCKKKKVDEINPAPTVTPTFRVTKIDYNLLTSTTPYNNAYFVDANGDSTVNRLEGHNRLRMIKAIDAYAKTASGTGTATLSASVFADMFANNNSPFTGIYSDLNTSDEEVRNVTAMSGTLSAHYDVMDQFTAYYSDIATASLSVANTADNLGNAGKLSVTAPSTSKYLVNAKGIEMGQVIAKSLIGAFQLDYISNVLLNEYVGLQVDNTKLVSGEKYTHLEHNWDIAYGVLTLKPIYAGDATLGPPASSGGESFLGSYVWEYNKPGFPVLHTAFLKGRAAVVNNDMTEMKNQAKIIREILEETMANAAIGYLGKWTSGADDAVRAHAIGEGLGFVYSTRFCKLNGADAAFSDGIINDLGVYTGNGFWDLTPLKVNTAATAIQAKFGL